MQQATCQCGEEFLNPDEAAIEDQPIGLGWCPVCRPGGHNGFGCPSRVLNWWHRKKELEPGYECTFTVVLNFSPARARDYYGTSGPKRTPEDLALWLHALITHATPAGVQATIDRES
jgi:hypothetical protein